MESLLREVPEVRCQRCAGAPEPELMVAWLTPLVNRGDGEGCLLRCKNWDLQSKVDRVWWQG